MLEGAISRIVIVVGFFLVLIMLFLIALPDINKASEDAEKASQRIASLEDVNGDAVADIVVKDGNGLEQFVLFGQSDGSFKNLEKILDDFSQTSEEELEKIREKYKRP